LFSALCRRTTPWAAIAVAALLFGLFHVVSGNTFTPERFLTSAFLGLLLGWVRLRTQSVFPCMVLHGVLNGLLLSAAYWQDELAQHGIGLEEQAHMPWTWLLAAAAGMVVAAGLLFTTTRRLADDDGPALPHQ
jgi:membrane protease YdiL (CAAX protease family)